MMLSEDNLRASLAERQPRQVPPNERTRYAAVATVLRFDSVPEVLLIRRTDKPEDPWSGHMAFPGGRRDDGDADLLATAIRETREEVGIDLGRSAELLGRLDDVQASARARMLDLVIVPYVFVLREPVAAVPSNDEVDETLWAPLEPMLRGETATTRPYDYRGQRLELPGFRVGSHIVWGLTYRMLRILFEVVRHG